MIPWPIFFPIASLALGHACPSASEVIRKNMGKTCSYLPIKQPTKDIILENDCDFPLEHRSVAYFDMEYMPADIWDDIGEAFVYIVFALCYVLLWFSDGWFLPIPSKVASPVLR